ncbi:MAG: ABC transporter substrate-binding protein [Lachnospiraceae bacterium]|nr:ABC transporter substrate-binding protein [Lachnospiraceae bacterium]
MKRKLATALAILMAATLSTATFAAAEEESHYPVTITTYDYSKNEIEVTFESCPQRVVCTNQTQTELMLYFGLDEYIAGVAYLDGAIREDLQEQYDQLVADGKELTQKGYPDKETVLALEPDMIFGWRSAFAEDALGDVTEWIDLGVGTMILRCSNNTASDLTINSVLADIADLGAIFDIEDLTDAYIEEAQEMLDEVAENVASLDSQLTVLIIEGYGDGSWYAWGSNGLTGSLVEAAGGINLCTEGANLSVEDIINYNPDVIIVDYMDSMEYDDGGEAAAAEAIEAITSESSLAEVTAVANGDIMAVNLTDVYGGGIRMVPSIEAMYEFMYGE